MSGDLSPQGEVLEGVPVQRVVDGDTFKVRLDGEDISVRLIGVDTPETVRPNAPVECFGPEASEFTKRALSGQKVTLEFDETQGTYDRYDRMLAYAWVELPDGSVSLFNRDLVAAGFGEAMQYGSTPGTWQSELDAASDQARADGRGLWAECR